MLPTQSQTRTPVGPTHALSKPDVFFSLEIETTNTAPCKGMLVNRFEEENSEIKALHAGTVTRVDKDKYEHIDLTPEELAEPGFVGKTMTLESVLIDLTTREVVAETRKT